MGGGLVQLAVYGSQDIFLTGTPQITFFKAVYRRYTNFAIEPIMQHLIGITNFNEEMNCRIEKIGDLMSRIYIEIDIPKVDLKIRNNSMWSTNLQTAEKQYNLLKNYYSQVYNFISENSQTARNLVKLLRINNIDLDEISKIVGDEKFSKNLKTARQLLSDYVSNSQDINEISNIPEFKDIVTENRYNSLQDIKCLDVISIYKSISNTKKYCDLSDDQYDIIIKNKLLNVIQNSLYTQMYDFYIPIYNAYLIAQKKYQSIKDNSYSERYKFAWVEELGHSLIDFIEIRIGDQIIDRHTGDWMIIFNKLFIHDHHVDNYNKMIGNVKELTVFDDSIKNSYKLIIPLQFWFCRHTGLSLPLIALRYSDVIITIKLKDLSKVCYYQDDPALTSMSTVQSQYDINIVDAKLYVDYVFLDTDERKRFAKSTHEYLIETIQMNEFDDIFSEKYNANLSFSNPTKFITWFVQPNFYRENPTGTNKCQWNNYGIGIDKSISPIDMAYILINGYNITNNNGDMKFFNYMHPYWYFNHSPPDGLNVYSFSIKPTIHQPSATINLSRIDKFSILMEFIKKFINIINDEYQITKGAYMGAYTMNYNILRIMNGMAGLAFQTSH
ncbi:capsid protein [Megavirus baoshan]|uniref:Putative capsid protein n=1 Tax=Megavirus baoshan TaxID=2496520 RepID=A0A3Q8U7W8_9VIRU|nr:capsid protein [Megavirus baoshan]AZL89403.1 capsid protein [Megavirus baoshan]